MKKIIVFTFLFFCLTFSVKADKIYYSEYGDYSEYSSTEIISNDTTDVRLKSLYKWYHVEKNLGDYYHEFSNPIIYPYIDYEDYINTSYSNWSQDIPEVISNRVIEEKIGYLYEEIKPVRYIHLRDLSGSYGFFRISELEIFIDGVKLNYSYECHLCIATFDSYIRNGIYYENMSSIANGGHLTIDMGNYYPVSSINVRMYYFDVGNDPKNISISYAHDKEYDRVYLKGVYTYNFKYKDFNEIIANNYSYNLGSFHIINPDWEVTKTSWEPLESSPIRKVNQASFYRYSDKKFRYYNQQYDYNEEYSETGDDYYNNKGEELKLYSYRTRDKVATKEELIITDDNDKLSDYILSSTSIYEVVGDIDYSKNGTYEIIYRFPFIDILTEVKVDIFSNKLDEYENKIEELENIIKDKNALIETLLQKIEELSNNELNYIEELTILQKELLLEKEKFRELQNNLNDLKDKYDANLINNVELKKEIEYLKDIINNNDYDMKDISIKLNDVTEKMNDYKIKLEEEQNKNNYYTKENNELINNYNNSIDDVKSLNDSIDYLMKKLNEKDELIKDYNEKYNQLMLDYENQKISCKLILDENDKEKSELEKLINVSNIEVEKIDISKTSLMNTKIGILFGLIFLLMFIYFLIGKRKKSNE